MDRDLGIDVGEPSSAVQQCREVQRAVPRTRVEHVEDYTEILSNLCKLVDFRIVVPALGKDETTWTEFKFKITLVAQALGIEEERNMAATWTRDVSEDQLDIRLKARSQVLYSVLRRMGVAMRLGFFLW